MARIGISGWRYAGWRGHFYPPGLPERLELAVMGRAVRRPHATWGTVESLVSLAADPIVPRACVTRGRRSGRA